MATWNALPTWRKIATVMAVIGFVAVFARPAYSGPASNLTAAVLNAAIWFAIVWVAWVVFRFVRGRRSDS